MYPSSAIKFIYVLGFLPNVYIVGTQALEVLSPISTMRNLPKPPAGERTAMSRPPTLLPPSNPSFQDGIPGAAAANAAPIICHANLLSGIVNII